MFVLRVGLRGSVVVVVVELVVVAMEWELEGHERAWGLEMVVGRSDWAMAIQVCFSRVAFSVLSVELSSMLQLRYSKSG
jgi:hypothetical protein